MKIPELFLFPKSREITAEDVWLTLRHIKLILLYSEGHTQGSAAKEIPCKPSTAHNGYTQINELSGCTNPQQVVGWAHRHGVLVIINKVTIAPHLEKGEG